MAFFRPDKFFDDIYDISPEQLAADGIKGVILDIDNTLVTYDDPEPFASVRAWFDALSGNGIKISFVSNNDAERVNLFNKSLSFPAYAKSAKPLPGKMKKVMAEMGTDKRNTLSIGDQVFTDVLCARFAGIKSYLVPPIKDKLTPAFRFKRALEKPILRGMKREEKFPGRERYFKKDGEEK